MAKSPLDAMKAQIAKGFKGKLRKGMIRRMVPGTGVDDFGDPVGMVPADFSFEGIRESFDASWAASAGIPSTDVGILVLLGSTAVEPKQGDTVQIEGMWHQVRRVLDIDPAGASMRLQAYEVSAP
ncbi:hypothetical protein C7441_11015 [Pseudaminobacter salicylatoxidans]|uniref:Head-tail joining protein n=1 Tax=Pseudaminobacter salicylatoxidans TaxID=93369 RepID=A0A316C1S9_PSESE|nr:hypothetical protein [Pseudaminobacter salicylatoxidans]PWJ81484.1 hypothetical protein C7441_11015 [Pseudaminobacter salicylatoxidans]